MASDRPLFIVNPASGGGRTGSRWPRLAAAVERAGLGMPDAVFTAAPGDGTRLAGQAIASGRTTVVAVGGDGTVNEVASAILGAGAQEGVRIGTIGMGTGKDVAKCLGIGPPTAAVRALRAGVERRIDAGVVACRDAAGRPSTRYFLLEASAGWVPEVSQSVPRWLKRLGDTTPYLIMTAVKMAGPMARAFTLAIDGEPHAGRYNSISVHNMELWGGDLVAAPGAAPDDGLFDVIRWGDLGRVAVLKAVQGQRLGGIHLEMDGIDRHEARLLELDADRRTALDLDGEHGDFLPARIEVLPGVLRFIAPPAGAVP